MLADFTCLKCGVETEEYFPTWKAMTDAIENREVACSKCKSTEVKKKFAAPHPARSEVPGYEKHNKDKLTVGKRFDMYHSKWV